MIDMTLKEVPVCDVCSKNIGHFKCSMCGKDVCQQCVGGMGRQNVRVSIDANYGFSKKVLCRTCRGVVSSVLRAKEAREEVGKQIDTFLDKLYRLGLADKL